MSQPNVPATATSHPCEVCHGRSTWDFLHDFYLRVEAAHSYSRRLENDLYDARSLMHQSQNALSQCEASLHASCGDLNEERLEHRASREELMFERERHKETMEILEKVFSEAVRSGEVADLLSTQVATLRAASDSVSVQETPVVSTSLEEDSLTRECPAPAEASACSRTEPVMHLTETSAGSPAETIGLSEGETQHTTPTGRESVADWHTQSRSTMFPGVVATLQSSSEGAAFPKKSKPATKRRTTSQGRAKRLA
ncbi:hypothetical protein DL98DRAFT_642498 [Cadophora sp. DSE1049]|nr:hypothetical protein DL98DRAFT_642498 [Cadophora sp. DSE1049]